MALFQRKIFSNLNGTHIELATDSSFVHSECTLYTGSREHYIFKLRIFIHKQMASDLHSAHVQQTAGCGPLQNEGIHVRRDIS